MPCKPTEAIRRKIQHGVSKKPSRGNDLATFLLHKFTFFALPRFYAFVLICPHKRFIHSRFKTFPPFLFLFSTDFSKFISVYFLRSYVQDSI